LRRFGELTGFEEIPWQDLRLCDSTMGFRKIQRINFIAKFRVAEYGIKCSPPWKLGERKNFRWIITTTQRNEIHPSSNPSYLGFQTNNPQSYDQPDIEIYQKSQLRVISSLLTPN
jgi:hypothetical protein